MWAGLRLIAWATAPARRALEDRRAAVKRELCRQAMELTLRLRDLEDLRTLSSSDHVTQHALTVAQLERIAIVHEALG